MLDGDLSYFNFIKELLLENPQLKHLIMSDISNDQMLVVKNLFSNSVEAYSRLIFQPLVPEYSIYFQACDLFIDSFPVGSALTHINMMSFRKATVVKINNEQPLYSFEYYLPEDYPYANNNLEDLKLSVKKLLASEYERRKVGNDLYDYYMKTYEFYAVKNVYKKIIDDIQLEELY